MMQPGTLFSYASSNDNPHLVMSLGEYDVQVSYFMNYSIRSSFFICPRSAQMSWKTTDTRATELA